MSADSNDLWAQRPQSCVGGGDLCWRCSQRRGGRERAIIRGLVRALFEEVRGQATLADAEVITTPGRERLDAFSYDFVHRACPELDRAKPSHR